MLAWEIGPEVGTRFIDGTLSLSDVVNAYQGYQRRQWVALRGLAMHACWTLSPYKKKGAAPMTPEKLIGRAPWDRRKPKTESEA